MESGVPTVVVVVVVLDDVDVVVVPEGAVVGVGIVVDDATQAADAGFAVACETRSPPPTRTRTITATRPLALRSKKQPMTASTNPMPRTARRFDPVEARHWLGMRFPFARGCF
jgi:hypothetical protein